MFRSHLEINIATYLKEKGIPFLYEAILFCFYPKPSKPFKPNKNRMPFVQKIFYSPKQIYFNNKNKHYLTDFVIQYYGLHNIETKGKICANSRAKRDQLKKHFGINTVFVKQRWFLVDYLKKVEEKAKELNIPKNSKKWWKVAA